MTNTEKNQMNKAIALAEKCEPIADRIPRVGAVIAIGNTIIGRGYRGSGKAGDDDHAEMVAINKVDDKTQLPRATLFTTLEPCTKDVRTDPMNCCTELIKQHGIKKVFIGILDPNQGVRGKGLWELQTNGIDVELFPPDLAKRLRVLNHKFIRIQQTLGIRITNLRSGQTIRTFDKGGVFELEGSFLNPPGDDVFVFSGVGGLWYPRFNRLQVTGDRKWAVNLHFGSYGPHTLCIVKTSDLGANLLRFYQKIITQNTERERVAKEFFQKSNTDGNEILQMLASKYPGIEMGALPKGIEVQAMVDIVVESPPATHFGVKQIS